MPFNPKLAIATVLTACVLPVGASVAGTLAKSGSSYVFTAAPGEKNSFVAEYDAGYGYTFYDQTAPLAPAPGCTTSDTGNVNCPADGITGVSAQLGDGDDYFQANHLQVPATADGAPGNDVLKGGDAGDTLLGGDGNDTLFGFDGADRYVGGPGDDKIDALGGGIDTLDCTGGGDDSVQRGDADTLVNCGSGPGATLATGTPRLRAFLKKGLPFSVTCASACAVNWLLEPGDGKTRRAVHTGSGILSRGYYKVDPDGYPVLAAAGRHDYVGTALGKASKKSLGRLRAIKVKITISASDAFTVEQLIVRTFTIKR
jgi:Ca2+-binding RTX toxin-like protein